MASSKDASSGDIDDKAKMLKEALKCVNGTLDFEKLSVKMGVANGEAMRKRFKRFFEKDEEPIQIKGSVLGNGDGADLLPATPATARKKPAKSTKKGDEKADITKPEALAKKRKASDTIKNEEGLEPEYEEDPSSAKKIKKTPVTKSATPKTPRSPVEPATPDAPGSSKPIEKANAAHKHIAEKDKGNKAGGRDGTEEPVAQDTKMDTSKPKI